VGGLSGLGTASTLEERIRLRQGYGGQENQLMNRGVRRERDLTSTGDRQSTNHQNVEMCGADAFPSFRVLRFCEQIDQFRSSKYAIMRV